MPVKNSSAWKKNKHKNQSFYHILIISVSLNLLNEGYSLKFMSSYFVSR